MVSLSRRTALVLPQKFRNFRSYSKPVSYTHLDVYKRQLPSLLLPYFLMDKIAEWTAYDIIETKKIRLERMLWIIPVSYTHLDVYKRQIHHSACPADNSGISSAGVADSLHDV